MVTNEFAKIITNREPHRLADKRPLSERNNKNMVIVTRLKTNEFLYNAHLFWNIAVKKLPVL